MARDSALFSEYPSPDHSFRHLILDYPRQAVEFFAPEEAALLDHTARVRPLRQELAAAHHDQRQSEIPLQVEWPGGRREVILFTFAEEKPPNSHWLARYCLDLSERLGITRIVPVVIFLKRASKAVWQQELNNDHQPYLFFRYLCCVLAGMPWERWQHSNNLVARLNLPKLQHSRADRIHLYASAQRGLFELEPSHHQRARYIDLVDIYTGLTDNEQQLYQHHYPREASAMIGFAQRYTEEGKQLGLEQGIRQGMQQGVRRGIEQGLLQGKLEGEREMLLRQITHRFGEPSADIQQTLQTARKADLIQWSEKILAASCLDDVFQ